MDTVLETITPEKATRYLEDNKNNRPIRQRHVEFLAGEITGGRWRQNGATIVFNGDELIDGQHRLWAVVTAGVPIKTLVVRGVDAKAFETIDTGLARTAGDVVSIMGNKGGATIATAARLAFDYEKGKLLVRRRISNGEIAQYVRDNKAIVRSAEFISSLSGGGRWLIGTGMAAGLHFLMAKKNATLADEFFTGIKSGFSDQAPQPFRAFRERMIQASLGQGKLRLEVVAAFAVKAWNAARRTESLSVFRFVDGEKFPKVA